MCVNCELWNAITWSEEREKNVILDEIYGFIAWCMAIYDDALFSAQFMTDCSLRFIFKLIHSSFFTFRKTKWWIFDDCSHVEPRYCVCWFRFTQYFHLKIKLIHIRFKDNISVKFNFNTILLLLETNITSFGLSMPHHWDLLNVKIYQSFIKTLQTYWMLMKEKEDKEKSLIDAKTTCIKQIYVMSATMFVC